MTAATDHDTLVREFVETFNSKNADALGPFMTDDVSFLAYGDSEITGRSAVVELWRNVFSSFEQVEFETVHQAVDGDVVIAEQVHGLGLPGGRIAPVMNMAIYEIRSGRIAAWRDYTNPTYAASLLRA